MMMAASNQERIEVLQEVLVKMDETAHALRSLHDSEIDAYCLAAFEGRNGGWLGRFERDILQGAAASLVGRRFRQWGGRARLAGSTSAKGAAPSRASLVGGRSHEGSRETSAVSSKGFATTGRMRLLGEHGLRSDTVYDVAAGKGTHYRRFRQSRTVVPVN
jgi:hypothetical protein